MKVCGYSTVLASLMILAMPGEQGRANEVDFTSYTESSSWRTYQARVETLEAEVASLREAMQNGGGGYNGCGDDCCDCVCPGWFASVGYVNWRPRRNDTDFVIVDPTDDAVVSGNRRVATFDQDNPGVRLGFGRRFESGWDLGFKYTNFFADGTSRSTLPAGGELHGTRLHPNATIGGDDAETASGNVRLQYDVIDLEAAYCVNAGCSAAFRFFTGFRYANLDNQFNVTYTEAANLIAIADRTNIDAYGLRAGLEGRWLFQNNFSLFGTLAGSVLAAETSQRYTNLQNGAQTHGNFRSSGTRALPVLETSLGVAWNRGPMTVQLGYELQAWMNAVDRTSWTDNGDPQNHTMSSHDILLDGIFVNLELRR